MKSGVGCHPGPVAPSIADRQMSLLLDVPKISSRLVDLMLQGIKSHETSALNTATISSNLKHFNYLNGKNEGLIPWPDKNP